MAPDRRLLKTPDRRLLKAPRTSLGEWLTPRRLRCSFIIAGAFWVTWAIIIAGKTGNLDLMGNAIGRDFSQFYGVGLLARMGRTAQFYDTSVLGAIQAKIIGQTAEVLPPYYLPPFFAFLFIPLTNFSYGVALTLWSTIGLMGLFFALRMLGADSRRTLPWVLTFFPVFAVVNLGQNTFLSITLMAGTYALWRRRRLVLAGLVLSLLLYKPQLVIGVLVLWGLEWRRDKAAFVGFGAGGATLGALCFGLLPEASRAYIELSRTTLPNIASTDGAALWLFNSVRSFFQLLLPGMEVMAGVLTGAVSLAALIGFIRLWKAYRQDPAVLYAGAVLITMILTPHALVYEWAILIVPAVLLWNARPADRDFLKSPYALLWLITLTGTAVTKVQLDMDLPITVNPSVPALLAACYLIWRRLMQGASDEGSELGIESTMPALEPARPLVTGTAALP